MCMHEGEVLPYYKILRKYFVINSLLLGEKETFKNILMVMKFAQQIIM